MSASEGKTRNARTTRGPGKVPRKDATEDQIRVRERRRQALELKRAGITYERIAETLGYPNRGNAYRDIQTALADITKQPAEELLAEELDRLDALLTGLWQKARVGDPQAVDRVLRVMDMRARYRGLYAPTRQTVTVFSEDAFDAEIRRLEQQLTEREHNPASADVTDPTQ